MKVATQTKSSTRHFAASLIGVVTFAAMLRVLWSFVQWFRAEFNDPVVAVVRFITNAIINLGERVNHAMFPDTPHAMLDAGSGFMAVIVAFCVCVILMCIVGGVGLAARRVVELGPTSHCPDSAKRRIHCSR